MKRFVLTLCAVLVAAALPALAEDGADKPPFYSSAEAKALAGLPQYAYQEAANALTRAANRFDDRGNVLPAVDYSKVAHTAMRDEIFQFYRLLNPNYAKCFLDQNLLYTLLDGPYYAVPLRFSDQAAACVYRREGESWVFADAQAKLLAKAAPYFDMDSIRQKTQGLELTELKAVQLTEYSMFLYGREASGIEHLWNLSSLEARLGNFQSQNYLKDFSNFLVKNGDEFCGPDRLRQLVKPDYTAEAGALSELGLLKGTEKGYELMARPGRVQALAMTIRVLGLEEEALASNYGTQFEDVPAGHWAEKYANYAFVNGIANGTGGCAFSPDQPIKLRDFLLLLQRAMGYQDTPGKYEEEAYLRAWQLGQIQDSVNFRRYEEGDAGREEEIKNLFLRGDMVKVIYQTLKIRGGI